MGKFIVYKHTNKLNGKCYIGQTSSGDVKYRWRGGKGYVSQRKFYNAILKYGWDGFIHDILDVVDTQEEANNLERYYIEKFNSIKDGYNIYEGGVGGKGRCKKVYQLDRDFNIINEFSSISEASCKLGLILGSISNCCHGKRMTTGGFYFCFKDEYQEYVNKYRDKFTDYYNGNLNEVLPLLEEKDKKNKEIKKTRGKPKKRKDKLGKIVAFEITEPLRQRIRECAFKKDVSFSAMVREILERYFEER